MDEQYKSRTGISQLLDYIDSCRRLNVEKFRKRHADAFLLHNGPAESLRMAPLAASPTQTASGRVVGRGQGPQWNLVVMPVKSSGRSPVSEFITVGRTENNDVVVLDYSASKFHAFFKQDEQGRFFLLDSGSRNGTFVDGVRVPARGKGDPLEVSSGAQVRFGLVEFTFWKAAEFHDLVKKMARR
jgi:hypothetical protein